MSSAPIMTDSEFHQSFLDLALAPADFHHAEHLRAAWCCFRQTGDFAAGAEQFVRHFRLFVTKIGAAAKYHETITWYYLTLVHQRMAEGPAAQSWADFRGANPDLFVPGQRLLRERYAPGTLEKPLARRVFLLPDAPSPA